MYKISVEINILKISEILKICTRHLYWSKARRSTLGGHPLAPIPAMV